MSIIYIIIFLPPLYHMYAIIDGMFFIAGIAGFVLCFTYQKPQYCPIPIVWIILYPLINELIYNAFANMFGTKTVYSESPSSRIVYHPSYNITFCGIQKLHPFDSQKYGNVFARLNEMNIIKGQSYYSKPQKIPRKLLLEKLSWIFLLKLNYSIPISSYIQMPLCFIPAFLLRWRVLNPMLLATQGTIIASIAALKLKWAINLSGGYHHAYCEKGGGFCIYPDITLAAHYMQTRHGIKRVMIIDLDAHQGNGHQRDHINRQDIFIVDAYNHHIYPGDREAKKAISQDIAVQYQTTNQQYFEQILSIEGSIKRFKPQFVIYNAGTDILAGDPLGDLSITQQGIIKRDQIIFDMCIRNRIPVVMVLSGGYQVINAKIIANSIKNLYEKFDKI